MTPGDRHAHAAELLGDLTPGAVVRPPELAASLQHHRRWGAAHIAGAFVTVALTLLGLGSFL